MRRWMAVLVALVGVLTSSAAAQDDEPRTVTTRVRHVSTLVLPRAETIVDVVVGDAEYWDVSASAHLAFVRPLMAGAESNLVILTASGAVLPVVVIERSEGAVDAVVRLGAVEGPGTAPVLAPVATVAAAARSSAAAWASVASAEAAAIERVDAARRATQAELDAGREAYPRRLQFVYEFIDREPLAEPFFVEGMWHDGERTYLRTRAVAPVLYEVAESGTVEAVTVEGMVGSVYVLPRVLGAGFLAVNGERLVWSMTTRRTGP